jgi:hypothetical protein
LSRRGSGAISSGCEQAAGDGVVEGGGGRQQLEV